MRLKPITTAAVIVTGLMSFPVLAEDIDIDLDAVIAAFNSPAASPKGGAAHADLVRSVLIALPAKETEAEVVTIAVGDTTTAAVLGDAPALAFNPDEYRALLQRNQQTRLISQQIRNEGESTAARGEIAGLQALLDRVKKKGVSEPPVKPKAAATGPAVVPVLRTPVALAPETPVMATPPPPQSELVGSVDSVNCEPELRGGSGVLDALLRSLK